MQTRFVSVALVLLSHSAIHAQEDTAVPAAETDAPAAPETAPTAEPPAAEPSAAEPPIVATTSEPIVEEPVQSAQDPVSTADAPAPRGPTKQGSIYMGSPVWLTDSPLDPGFEVELRSGIKIKSWVPEMGVGARWNWFNVDKVREQYPSVIAPNQFAGENLTGIWFSLGVRYEPEMKSKKIQPYVSLAFDANLWGFSYETTEVCGFWSCGTMRQYDFAPGFSSRVGLRIQPNPAIGIDLGAKPAMTFQGWAFENTQAWIEPYAGLTFLMGRR